MLAILLMYVTCMQGSQTGHAHMTDANPALPAAMVNLFAKAACVNGRHTWTC